MLKRLKSWFAPPVLENTMPRLSQLVNGLIVPPTHLEVIVCDHCNIRCAQCNHASPALKRWFADPDDIFRDLSILAPIYRPKYLKLLGGEPLLHKNLLRVLQAARQSGVSPSIRLVTNGLLLARMPEEAWPLIDVLEVSVYPGQAVPPDALRQAHERTKVEEFHYPTFRQTFAGRGTQDSNLIQRVYQSCKLANLWGCHSIRQGFFYKCPQSIYIQQIYGDDPAADRIDLSEPSDLQMRIFEFINSPVPLQSCRFCAGTSGKSFPHHQTPNSEWLDETHLSLEQILSEP